MGRRLQRPEGGDVKHPRTRSGVRFCVESPFNRHAASDGQPKSPVNVLPVRSAIATSTPCLARSTATQGRLRFGRTLGEWPVNHTGTIRADRSSNPDRRRLWPDRGSVPNKAQSITGL